MTPEDLLKILKEGGLDDAAIQKLLSDTLASLKGPAENEGEQPPAEDEKAQAGKLLGVTL